MSNDIIEILLALAILSLVAFWGIVAIVFLVFMFRIKTAIARALTFVFTFSLNPRNMKYKKVK